MGYEQNNGYYQNEGSHDQSWRDQTNVYQTQREQPTPMGSRSPCRKSGWFKGVLAVLLVLVISFGALYLIRNVGVRLEKTKDGFTLSMTDRTRTPEQTLSAPEDTQEPLPRIPMHHSPARLRANRNPARMSAPARSSTSSPLRRAPTPRSPTKRARCVCRIFTAASLTASSRFPP